MNSLTPHHSVPSLLVLLRLRKCAIVEELWRLCRIHRCFRSHRAKMAMLSVRMHSCRNCGLRMRKRYQGGIQSLRRGLEILDTIAIRISHCRRWTLGLLVCDDSLWDYALLTDALAKTLCSIQLFRLKIQGMFLLLKPRYSKTRKMMH